VLVLALVLGFAQWRHVEHLRTDLQVEAVHASLTDDATSRSERRRVSLSSGFSTTVVHGFWGSAVVPRPPDVVLGDLSAASAAVGLASPSCLQPSERNRALLERIDPDLPVAWRVCDVGGRGRHLGRVAVFTRADGGSGVRYELGARSFSLSIRHLVPDG
jgi:hypothetical protein